MNKRKKIFRVAAWFLALCMVSTVIPFAASAATLSPAEGWEIPVRNDANMTMNSTDSITIKTAPGELYTVAENYWLRAVEAGSDFSLTLKVSGKTNTKFQKAGLIIWAGNNYMENVNVLRRWHNSGEELALSTCIGQYGWKEPYVADTDSNAPVWLKLEKSGTNFIGYYRYSESDDWTKIGEHAHADIANAVNLKIGVLAVNAGKNATTPTTFTLEDFTLNGTLIPFAVGEDFTLSLKATDYLPLEGSGQAVAIAGDENAEIQYMSSNINVLKIDEKTGLMSALADGRAVITATAIANGVTKTATAEVLVGDGDENTCTLLSPDGKQKAIIDLDEKGVATYRVFYGNEQVIGRSKLGLITDAGNFTEGLTLANLSENQAVTDRYALMGAKVSKVEASGNERVITYQKGGIAFKVIARMYDDGFAFRYAIDGSGALSISSEGTTVQLPADAAAYAMAYAKHNEASATQYVATALNGNYCEPLLYETKGGNFALLSEAAIDGNYCGTYLKGDGTGALNYHFSAEQSGNVSTTLPFKSPWRFAVIGAAETVAMNTMAETLSPAAEGDFSWVEAGASSWTWLNGDSVNDFETYKKYVDFTAEMGWKYLLLDEGWQPRATSGGKVYAGYYDWFESLLSYAKEKGVGLLVWANHNDLLDDTYRRELFAEWSEMGIAGIKPDFFNSSSQSYYQLYEKMYEETAEYHLLLNLHGIPKPAGERRTYPQLLTREGILGHENMIISKASQLTAAHNCLLPFLRGAVGPADYTPMLSHSIRGAQRLKNFSLAHMAALPIVMESGLQTLADKPETYLNSAAMEYFDKMPASWEESRVLAADPGELAVFARRNGENWYLGGICNTAKTAELDLSFLGEGTYYAVLVKDGEDVDHLSADYLAVTKDTELSIPMVQTGGFAMKIMSEKPENAEEILLDRSTLSVKDGESAEVHATLLTDGALDSGFIRWESSNEQVATVKNGVVTGLSAGTAIITARCTAFGKSISASCTVTVIPVGPVLGDGWTIKKEDADDWSINEDYSISIRTQKGDFFWNNSSGNTHTDAKNVFLHNVEKGDFTVTVKMDYKPSVNYETAGLIIYREDLKNFAFTRRYHQYLGTYALCTQGINANEFKETNQADPSATQEPLWLKIQKSGTTLSCFYSLDGQSWQQHQSAIEWSSFAGAEAADLKVGLYVGNDNANGSSVSTFSNFSIQYAEDAEATALPLAMENSYEEKAVEGIALNKERLHLAPGEYSMLTASFLPADATNQNFTWSVTNEQVATVENGVVKAQREGCTLVTVTTADGEFSASCFVQVGDSMGDTNGDDKVSVADLVRMVRYLSEKISIAAIDSFAADLNGDGTLDTADAVLLAKALL